MADLAMNGGDPVRSIPIASWPYFSEETIERVADILRTGRVNFWTGSEIDLFEKEYASHLGTSHAVALANGTVALEAALYACDIGPGDEVIIPSRTFIATASSVIMRGATPVVCDVDQDSQNLTAETARNVLTSRTKAIIAVHLAGWPCDMEPIVHLAREKGVTVIEDCAQSHGARYHSVMTGTIGDINIFSFCQDKIISTGGEGGLLSTNDSVIWDKVWSYKDHGKKYDTVFNKNHQPGFRWLHETFGTNWRMTELQAGIGRIQLGLLEDWVNTRRENAAYLNNAFSELPALRVTIPPDDVRHSYYKYYMFVRSDRLRKEWDRDKIMAAVNAEGIPCSVGSCSEIYLEKAFGDDLRPGERLPVARQLGETSLMLHVHPTMSREDLHDTCTAVEKVMEVATTV